MYVAILEIIFYRIEPSLGKVKSVSAESCKHIKEVLTTSCASPPTSGVYWVKDMQVAIQRYIANCITIISNIIFSQLCNN